MNLKPRFQAYAWALLQRLSSALPQGLILIGPAGVGKRRAVRALFQWINCSARASETAESSLFGESPATAHSKTDPQNEDACGTCSSCRKIAEQKHVDFIEIAPTGETIAVDDLREMKKTLFFPPTEAKQRFVLIDQAHKLNAFSANNLLKTLEEPPSHTRFFLVTHERGLLLPTIISRCQFIHFAPLDAKTLEDLLTEMGIEIPEPVRATCLALLGGGLHRAAMLADAKVLDFIQSVQKTIQTSSKSGGLKWGDIVALADQLPQTSGSNLDRAELFLDLVVKRAHEKALFLGSRDQLHEAKQYSNLALKAAKLRRRLELHANKKLVSLAGASLLLDEPEVERL